MRIVKEIRLSQFEFWSGAIANAEKLTNAEFQEIENYLEEYYIDPLDATTINDMFWFDFQFIVENILGYVYIEEYGTILR